MKLQEKQLMAPLEPEVLVVEPEEQAMELPVEHLEEQGTPHLQDQDHPPIMVITTEIIIIIG